MKKIIYTIIAVLTLFSCEKVIDVNLDNESGKVVIDATIVAPEGKCVVKVSENTDFYQDNPVKYNDNAKVKVTNLKTNKIYNIPLKSNGTYEALVDVEYLSNYRLDVEIDGVTYGGESFLNSPVTINEIYFKKIDKDKDELKVICKFDDTDGYENYYRCILTHNDSTYHQLFYLKDDDDDEKDEMSFSIRQRGRDRDDDEKILEGDNISLELLTLDKVTYKYYDMLSDVITLSDREPDAPSNPDNNLNNGALGYFSVYHSNVMSVVAKEQKD